MAHWALQLDDRSLPLAADGTLRTAAQLESLVQGGPGARHWHEFAGGRRGSGPVAAAVAADLEGRFALTEATLRIVAPPHYTPAALGQLLGLARAGQRRVTAFIDAAALTAATLGAARGSLVVDLGRQHLAVARVDRIDTDQGPVAQRRRVLVGEKGGAATLADLWLELVSDALVRRTRFDPLHDRRTELGVREALPRWARAAAVDGEAVVRIEFEGQVYQVTLSRDQFAAPAQPLYRELAGLLHELRPAGAVLDIVVPQSLIDLPGVDEALDIFAGCTLRVVPDGFAACAASLIPEHDLESGGVRLLRHLPLIHQSPLLAAVSDRLLGTGGARETPPTHVLHGGKAIPLGTVPLEIGRDPATSGIRLAEGLAGVSRLHCSLRREDGAVVLIDSSRHGTFINGERVAGRARLRAGDALRIGDPGVELNLIAVGGA